MMPELTRKAQLKDAATRLRSWIRDLDTARSSYIEVGALRTEELDDGWWIKVGEFEHELAVGISVQRLQDGNDYFWCGFGAANLRHIQATDYIQSAKFAGIVLTDESWNADDSLKDFPTTQQLEQAITELYSDQWSYAGVFSLLDLDGQSLDCSESQLAYLKNGLRGAVACEAERARRRKLWEALQSIGATESVPASRLNELGVFNGGRGIYFDKNVTSIIRERDGVAVGLLHTGEKYADDLYPGGAIYHYPSTRSPGRDKSEIQATKAAARLNLPVFLSIDVDGTNKRLVKFCYVTGWNDDLEEFALSYSNTLDDGLGSEQSEAADFIVTKKREKEEIKSNRSKRHPKFKINVFNYYADSRCCLCNNDIPEMLEAAHIVDVCHDGTDDKRNGLILCANHHLAFDNMMFAIRPGSLEIVTPEGSTLQKLGIKNSSLLALSARPHDKALGWRWDKWCESIKRVRLKNPAKD